MHIQLATEVRLNTDFYYSFSSNPPNSHLCLSSARGKFFKAWFKVCIHKKRKAKAYISWMLKIHPSVHLSYVRHGLPCWDQVILYCSMRYLWMERAGARHLRGPNEGTKILIMLSSKTTYEMELSQALNWTMLNKWRVQNKYLHVLVNC